MRFLTSFKYRFGALFALIGLATAGLVYAQLEGTERGVAPLASSGDFEVFGVEVDTRGKNAFEARQKGWEEAQRKAWIKLYARTQGGKTAGLSDSALNNIVSAIIVEEEQIGPTRYIARLGVMFDRARAGQILGVGGRRLRSPPLLVLPIMWSEGSPQVFENKTEWQKAWARFRAGDSAIDYVRPYGSDAESLMLTAGQAERHDRRWWRMILDQFGAADVIVPIVRMQYEYPGGPVTARFSARYGPDNKYIESFTLKTKSSDGIPSMMNQAIERLDKIYTSALSRGVLRTDKSLIVEDDGFDLEALEQEIEAELASETGISSIESSSGGDANSVEGEGNTAAAAGAATTVTIQFDTPDVGAVSRGESSVRSVPGVSSASTSSLALGGVSVMRVSFTGNLSDLASALRSRGWQVQQGSGALRISRGGGTPAAQGANSGSDEPEQ
ncbi:heavy-metal-associated domain-containing protein [Parasphingorhabdus cellanae]|uniref:Heavy-metal-associated domain-containing protein n=1 Tax=Parasphingorhabdus cellanae TaxID=2806553 RepID=A0ABX7T943_9SPHN|nr:heavy-metal-associated domain-containing protein [Parasphingorhabdus cellanae]QTD56820.1 heavy-metal-associated domain-containing protein [Parasphingorhabdus cellanae]